MPIAPGLRLDDVAVQRIETFVGLVRSSPHNLLSARAVEELESRHVPECLGLAAMIPPDAAVLDVGTGGGFPGMIVAIARPDLDVTLLDSTSKKVAFLADAAAAMRLRLHTLAGRSEELVRSRAGSVDIVTARAVAPLRRLLPWTLPWLRPGGRLYAMKGERWEEEVRDAVPVLRRMRAAVVDVTRPGERVPTGNAALPEVETPRVVIIRVPG